MNRVGWGVAMVLGGAILLLLLTPELRDIDKVTHIIGGIGLVIGGYVYAANSYFRGGVK